MVLLVCTIIILLLGAMLAGLQAFRATTVTDLYNVTTAGETTANITLSQSILDSDTLNASVSSNISADAALIAGYTATTKVLVINGLDTGTTLRRLTAIYKANQLGNFVGVDIAAKLWPTFYIIGLIGVVVAAMIYQFRGGD